MKKNKTVFARTGQVKREWQEIDASGKILGRLASKIAVILSGKNKAIYTPHVDCGDFVVVINAEKVRVTGRKEKQKIYFTHSDYPGGAKHIPFDKMIEKKPEEVIRLAVSGMLPKSRMGKQMIRKLKVYAGKTHPHLAQKTNKIEL